MVLRLTAMGMNRAEHPMTRPRLAMLLPTILPQAISPMPLMAAFNDAASSGADVPKATSVMPMIRLGFLYPPCGAEDELYRHGEAAAENIRVTLIGTRIFGDEDEHAIHHLQRTGQLDNLRRHAQISLPWGMRLPMCMASRRMPSPSRTSGDRYRGGETRPINRQAS